MYQVPTNELFPILLLMLIVGYIERGNEEDSIVNCEFNIGLSTLVFQRTWFTYDAVFRGGVRLGAPGTKKE
jgi:hypothetical protein